MSKQLYILFLTVVALQNIEAQCRLTIRQVGLTGPAPELLITDIEGQKPKRINDSTIQFNVPPTRSECLFIIIEGRWFTRVWIDSTIPRKELIINYSKKTATIKDGNERDRVLENMLKYVSTEENHKADSMSSAYVKRNPDQYFSLWLLSHGLNREHPEKNLKLLDNLSQRLKEYPEYRKMKANLTERRIPNYGDPFREFTLVDKNEKPFISTTIDKKIIVLHFWSTGCAPCIKGMDALVKFYRSFDTSAISFISISLDDDKNKWKKSSTTNKITWTNLWTEDGTYCDLCLHYNLMAMPYFVIFNKEKKITFYNDGEDIDLLRSKISEIK